MTVILTMFNYIKISYIKNSENVNLLKPKCIIIGTLPSIQDDLDNFKDLYVKTMIEINIRYSYFPEQILFFHIQELSRLILRNFLSLSNYSKVQRPSSLVVNYLLENDLELVVGSLSTALYYAKIIFGKNNVFYLNHVKSLEKKDKDKNFLNAFEAVGIKNFLTIRIEWVQKINIKF